MEVIAQDAGYSRAALYRQFPNRESLDAALIQRTTQRHMMRLLEGRDSMDPIETVVEILVIVATELAHDPLLRTISEAADEGTVAQMLANSATVSRLAEPTIEAILRQDDGERFRSGIRPQDLTQFLTTTALSLLLGIVPDSENADVARDYIETFILPAFINDPPQPRVVFPLRVDNDPG
ncbi:TetR/AcrR family transcriptional regulator [Mycobacterium paraterrae]|uniref:TetR/AcrR family transcriptional regulator n=1 Tax=Mycobacterium paraterrae TaxID=577492 RepID=A0ABY3VJL8_9MYCO|nr:TetR/AcrR family transcriptional regulator [Mycobacterium paraterrae]UMB69582.1 TetR/AcrR family transcriptional regulator [Mycobacterium paraterrae]